MAAYLVSEVTPRDADAFQTYRTKAAASIAQYGGRYLARGGDVDTLEGSWKPRTIIIVEFPDVETARRWYSSSEYAALAVQNQALERNLILVDGISATNA
ncbi:DUF1330 domain-containing protein [Rhizobium leucaenae]|uniref:Uncharacterized protein (DUF1330 family) n=1 Tax=Rhizobium leucaenae TaxID=29450 RepID=A0A7W6ZSX8_9HYPH|nr:DUF1330 domain-containing protein [Rhizobium leucaenae]MBB4568039.1 uncharacterized protein (DUF1330 family) [Rhizobium leucaenae]MBB6301304.1 uncharacterized protein (DUF1330 family) [Rhizobium leucaenae]